MNNRREEAEEQRAHDAIVEQDPRPRFGISNRRWVDANQIQTANSVLLEATAGLKFSFCRRHWFADEASSTRCAYSERLGEALEKVDK